MKQKRLQLAAGFLAAAVLLGGCGESAASFLSELIPEVEAGATISENSKWINSDVAGAVDETVTPNLKDDFHTAVNYDWILETETGSGTYASQSTFTDTEKVLEARNYQLLERDNTQVDPDMMCQEDYDHLQDLTTGMADLLTDWDTRNESGKEPLRQYVEELESLDSLEELSSYLASAEGWGNLSNLLVELQVSTPQTTRAQYSVYVMPFYDWSLWLQDEYNNLSISGDEVRIYNEKAMQHVLGSLGYSDSEIRQIIRENYTVETTLAAASLTGGEIESVADETDETLTLAQLQEKVGAYPLTQIMETFGLADSNLFSVYQPEYLTEVSRIYTEKNFKKLKSFYLMHLVLDALPYLDEECYNDYLLIYRAANNLEGQPVDAEEELGGSKDTDMALAFEETLMSDALDTLYVARHCTSEDKEYLTQLTNEAAAQYRVMLQEEDWLSEETKAMVLEKLDAMALLVLYPDTLSDYSELEIDPSGNAADAVNAVKTFYVQKMSEKVNQPVLRTDWTASPRTLNAAYDPSHNAICIYAGLLADDGLYDRNGSYEYNLGRIGMIIGHEITHGFDTNGCQYDKEGYQTAWLSKADEEILQQKAEKVNRYFHSFTPIAGQMYTADVSGEAMADMGGMKCALALAAKAEDFDYQEFFRSFAGLWKTKCTYDYEMSISKDVHPLAFLRTNVTVQQFEEFYEAFGITEGDGMYLAPEERLIVW